MEEEAKNDRLTCINCGKLIVENSIYANKMLCFDCHEKFLIELIQWGDEQTLKCFR